jgi:putative hemolysin
MVTEVLIILALILANGVFSGAEIAIVSLRKTRIRELLDSGSTRAKAVEHLRKHPERFLATVQIGITVVGATAAAFGGQTLVAKLVPPLKSIGFDVLAHDVAFAIVVGGISFLSLVIGELVPKSLGLRYAEGYALAVGRPLLGLAWLMRPLVRLLTGSSNLLLKLFGDKTSFGETRISPGELQQMVEEATETGALDPHIGNIASRALEFAGVPVSAVMVPRERMVAIPRRAPAAEVKRIILEQGYSRMPVYEGSPDTITGYVIAKDILALDWESELLILDDITRPAHFVPETMRAVQVLRDLQHRRIRLAIVVDEMGAVSGLVTIEDLVEELVGEIFSESDTSPELARKEPDGSMVAQGSAPIRDLNRQLDLDLPEAHAYTTLAGLCIHLAGRIPPSGAKLTAPDGTTLEILDATTRRIRTVRIRRP